MIDNRAKPEKLHHNRPQSSRRLKLFIVVLLAFGLFFRLANIDEKVYQHDEVMTSLRLAGFRVGEVRQQIAARYEISIRDLQQYQRVSSERGVFDTLLSLAADDPKHPPLYYILARMWAQAFGDSIIAIRSLSVVMSLLTLACLYWLGRELFGPSRTAWITVALVAISPFHVLYAQEARQYSLWTLTIVLSSTALLRALRVQIWRSWTLYAATVTMGLYTHILFVLVVLAHGIYVTQTNLQKIAIKQFSLPKEVTQYLLASSVAFLLFAPWAVVITFHLPILYETTHWITKEVGVLYMLKRGILGISSLFVDPSGSVIFSAKSAAESPMIYWIRFPVLLLIGYSFFFLCRKAPKRVWFFILSLTGGTMVPLILVDTVTGWHTSTPFRYLTPSYVGIQLSVAYLLASETVSSNSFWQKSWQAATAVLAACAIASCVRSMQAEVWWNKEASYILPQITHPINQAVRPLLISTLDGTNLGNNIALSYLLDAKVRFRAISDAETPQDLNGPLEVFILNPSDNVIRKLQEKRYKIQPVINSGALWSLAKELGEH